MRPFRLTRRAKAAYHAAAVFASNYFVVVEAVAHRLLQRAGVPRAAAWRALRPLVEGTLENLARGPAAALTGPVVRGDVTTIRRHRAALPAADEALYRALGRGALALAREGGMDDATAGRVAAALATGRRPARRRAAKR
jgi:predicted short-subunit dehydrogenase-like oxidoreductase (DUF2520 family)